MATSMLPPEAPNRKTTMARVMTSGASGMRMPKPHSKVAVMRIKLTTPMRWISHALPAMARTLPPPSMNRLSARGSSPSLSLKAGICVAQTPKRTPWAKNMVAVGCHMRQPRCVPMMESGKTYSCLYGPDHPLVVQDGVQRQVKGFRLEVVQIALREPQADGERFGLQDGQGAVVEPAAIAEPIAARCVAHAGHEKQRGDDGPGALGLGEAGSFFFHRAAGMPGMKAQRLVLLVDHGQADAAAQGLALQFAVFLPAVQRGQGVELALDRPVGADHGVGPVHQPDAHDLLQQIGPLQAVGQVQAFFDQRAPKGCFVHQIISPCNGIEF